MYNKKKRQVAKIVQAELIHTKAKKQKKKKLDGAVAAVHCMHDIVNKKL